jgi:threonine/homoserine/homoserine lactone efflux protein
MMDFLPTLPVLGAYAVAVLVITFTPGPDMTLFLGKAVAQGRAAGMAAMLGATTGILVHTSLVALGLSALIAASATAFTILKVVGALYLLWLAFEAVRRGSGFNLDADGRAARREPLSRIWMKGLAVNLLNPKIIMFFVTFLPQFVQADDPAAAPKLLFLGVLFVAIALPLSIAMILSAAHIARYLQRSPGLMRAIDWLFAGVFGAFALRLLFARAEP